VGSAKLLGIDLAINFSRPYFSRGIREFWRRWHITLSSWLKDYVYIPLGGGRVRLMRRAANILITFIISGLWHGANWTFIFWGALHGLYQTLETIFKLPSKGNVVTRFLQRGFSFGLICLTWIFFRANTMSDAFYMLRHLPSGWRHWLQPQTIINALTGMKIHLADALINILLIVILVGLEAAAGEKNIFERLEDAPSCIRLCFYCCIAVLVMAFGAFYSAGQFIYFQF
jgi:D-alanyl-lipoteichoic acid acyltransferase DltB (MBOAT superfamily)